MAQSIYLIALAAATIHMRPCAASHLETRGHLSGQPARHWQVRGGLCEDRDVPNPHRDARSLVRGSLNRDPSAHSPDRELPYRHPDLRSGFTNVRSPVRDLLPLIHETHLTTRGTYLHLPTSIPMSQLSFGPLAASFILMHVEFAMIVTFHHIINAPGYSRHNGRGMG